MKQVWTLLSWLLAGILLFFTGRRWLFMLAALGFKPTQPGPLPAEGWPGVLLLAPVRNEARALPGLLQSLNRLDYPPDLLTVVVVNDGSTDGTPVLARQWVARSPRRHLLTLERNIGKAGALNIALARFPHGSIIAVYDADERPRPDALRFLAAAFADGRVGGVSGRRAVANALDGPAAAYTAFEGLVHQLVTMQAKDYLNLVPAMLGSNCAYRRTALAQAGGFKSGALLEDTDLTLRLARAGWQTRFEPRAVSFHHAPKTVRGYWQQHTRWARGFNNVAREQAAAVLGNRRLAWPARLELVAFSLGYLDRPVLLASAILLAFKQARPPLPAALAAALLTPLLQIVVALQAGRLPVALWRQLVWVPLFFGLDVAMALTAFWKTLVQSPQTWEERQARP